MVLAVDRDRELERDQVRAGRAMPPLPNRHHDQDGDRKSRSAGLFYPTSVREDPPSVGALVVLHTARDCLRVSTILACLCYLVQPSYAALYAIWTTRFALSDQLFYVAATLVIHSSMYYGFNGIFMAFEPLGIMQKYRIERSPAQLPSRALITKTFIKRSIGLVVLSPILLYLLYPLLFSFGMTVKPDLPSFLHCIANMAFAVLVNDALFYWSHRLLHHPRLYAKFHKQHHEYKGTIGIAAEYSSIPEQFLSNYIPSVLGPMLVGMSNIEWCVYLVWRLWRTYEVHSGYDFSSTFLGKLGLMHGHGARYHDFHHTHNQGNFGGPANAFWDYFFCTQNQFVAYAKKKQLPNYHSRTLY